MTQEELKKQILAELKKEGLEITEEALFKVLAAFERLFTQYATVSPNKMDDLLLPFLPMLSGMLKVQIDKVDGEVDLKNA